MKVIRISGIVDKDYKKKLLLFSTKHGSSINTFIYVYTINIDGQKRKIKLKITPKKYLSYTHYHSYNDVYLKVDVSIYKDETGREIDVFFDYKIDNLFEFLFETFVYVKEKENIKYVVKFIVEEHRGYDYYKAKQDVLKTTNEKRYKEPMGIYYYNSLSNKLELIELIYVLMSYYLYYGTFGVPSVRLYLSRKFEAYGYDDEFVDDYIKTYINKNDIEYYIALILCKIRKIEIKLVFNITEEELDDWYEENIKKLGYV